MPAPSTGSSVTASPGSPTPTARASTAASLAALSTKLPSTPLRTAVLAGGYRLREPGQGEPLVIAASGPVLSEVLDAAAGLEDEGVAATVIDVTSLDRLFRGWKGTLADAARHAEPATSAGHLEMLLTPSKRTAPIVTVHDAASHSMAWLGSVFGQRVVPVGVDSFGESGTIEELYDVFGLLPAQMVNAALVGLSRRRSAPAAVRSR